MSIAFLNKVTVNEVKSNYYQVCDARQLSNRDLLTLVLEPLVKNKELSIVVDDVLQKGLPYLASLSEFELSHLFGLSEHQSFHLMAVFEIARRIGRPSPNEEITIRQPSDIQRLVDDIRFLDREHFVSVYLNTKNVVIGRETISIGSLNAAVVHPREVFKQSIRRGAASVVFAHNHPSMNTQPSPEDLELTKRLVECGELLGIDVLDHVIIGGMNMLSLKEAGYM